MAHSENLPNGIEVQSVVKGDPGNGLPKFVREAASERGYGDSSYPWTMYVHPDDIDAAFREKAHGNGNSCVMAQAGRRLGAQTVYFYRTTAWVDFGSGPIVRYFIPDATYRNVIDPFDKNDRKSVLPGMYPLTPPSGSHSLTNTAKKNRKRGSARGSRGLIKNPKRQHSDRVILAPKVGI